MRLRRASLLLLAAGPLLAEAPSNASQARDAIRLCHRLACAWLEQADPVSGLLPRNLRGDWYWNAQDAAADNFPFHLLTAFITDHHHLKRSLLEMLEAERRLTPRLDRLPDDFLFDRQGFRDGAYKLDAIIFGASEYAKDGLTPITEWLGPGAWLDRLQELVRDIWKHAPAESPLGRLPSNNVEVNGNMLQVSSRLYWMTGEEDYRRWAFRLADHYFLHESILEAPRLQLDDHACEIIGGLSEAYLLAAKTDAARHAKYRPAMHALLDRILRFARNGDGLLYHTIDPRDGRILRDELTDNWGYTYNAFLTVAEIDGVARFREAVVKVLSNLPKYVNYPWEGAGADGYADSIEGAINLLSRIPSAEAGDWVDRSMRILVAKQREDGLMESWYGDGNSARTALMYALMKTQGVTASPWRTDLELGAARIDGKSLRLWLRAEHPWRGKLRFDRPRHRDLLRMPVDYPRINQFPEWFTVEERGRYEVYLRYGEPVPVSGKDLVAGYPLTLDAGREIELTVTRRDMIP